MRGPRDSDILAVGDRPYSRIVDRAAGDEQESLGP